MVISLCIRYNAKNAKRYLPVFATHIMAMEVSNLKTTADRSNPIGCYYA